MNKKRMVKIREILRHKDLGKVEENFVKECMTDVEADKFGQSKNDENVGKDGYIYIVEG